MCQLCRPILVTLTSWCPFDVIKIPFYLSFYNWICLWWSWGCTRSIFWSQLKYEIKKVIFVHINSCDMDHPATRSIGKQKRTMTLKNYCISSVLPLFFNRNNGIKEQRWTCQMVQDPMHHGGGRTGLGTFD